jgi:CopG family nickel-responsive transcriptional regulator
MLRYRHFLIRIFIITERSRMSQLTRFSVSMDDPLLRQFDALIETQGYTNRSEALRDLVRNRLIEAEWEKEGGEAKIVGTITLIYDHHQRELADRLTEQQHSQHHLVISTMHVHLDHDHCLEVLVVKGGADSIHSLAGHLIGLKGVKHGKLVMTSSGKNL